MPYGSWINDLGSIAFPQAGTYHYVCTLHSRDMDGEVIVR